MMKHPETNHEMEDGEHEDYSDMLEEAHEHAKAYGPEHHATMLESMRKEHDEYEPMEEHDEEDEHEDKESSEKSPSGLDEDEKPKKETMDSEESEEDEYHPMHIIIGIVKKKNEAKRERNKETRHRDEE
jgi:hypothetical protein